MFEVKAQEWVTKHGLTVDDIKTIEVRSSAAQDDTLFVELEQPFDWIFGRALGLTNSDVSAKSAARVGSLAGGHEFLPWAMVAGQSDCLGSSGEPLFGASCVVKLGAGDATTGWYGALDADGNGGGSAEYQDNIIDGDVDWTYCIQGDPSPGCAGAHTTIGALSGNKVGPTDSGIQDRLARGAQCDANGTGVDEFEDVLEPNLEPARTARGSSSFRSSATQVLRCMK
jgi:hypothetical protein